MEHTIGYYHVGICQAASSSVRILLLLTNEERYGRLNYCSNGAGSSNSGTRYGLQQHEDT